MGTHPIFESDFDCLTVLEMTEKFLWTRSEKPQIKARFVDDQGCYVYYTAGSATGQQRNNEDIVGIGIYGGEDMQFCGCDPYGNTSNYAQLFAIQVALSFAWNRGDRRITIRTGSEFAKKCILHLHNDHWLARYGTGQWFTAEGTPVVDRGVLYNIVEMKKLFEEVWIEWVPRNSDTGSRAADELARCAHVISITKETKWAIEEPLYPP